MISSYALSLSLSNPHPLDNSLISPSTNHPLISSYALSLSLSNPHPLDNSLISPSTNHPLISSHVRPLSLSNPHSLRNSLIFPSTNHHSITSPPPPPPPHLRTRKRRRKKTYSFDSCFTFVSQSAFANQPHCPLLFPKSINPWQQEQLPRLSLSQPAFANQPHCPLLVPNQPTRGNRNTSLVFPSANHNLITDHASPLSPNQPTGVHQEQFPRLPLSQSQFDRQQSLSSLPNHPPLTRHTKKVKGGDGVFITVAAVVDVEDAVAVGDGADVVLDGGRGHAVLVVRHAGRGHHQLDQRVELGVLPSPRGEFPCQTNIMTLID